MVRLLFMTWSLRSESLGVKKYRAFMTRTGFGADCRMKQSCDKAPEEQYD